MDNFWQGSITVGKYTIPRFMAAPLDGVTDSPLRQLIREFSPKELLFSEMRHVACVVNEKQGHSLKYNEGVEHPISYQVSANKIDFIRPAVEKIAHAGFDMLNLNIGCPAKAVCNSGSGSALMANIPQLKVVLKELRQATEGIMPFTLKMRAGYKERNGLEVAQIAQDHGVEMLIVHPRTAPEMFTSRLDFDLVRKIKETVQIPVVFSGNITNFARAQKTYELTGADGFMIGRALWGCPWKIHEILLQAQGQELVMPVSTMLVYALKHLQLNFDHYGIRRGANMFKKQLPQYVRGVAHAADLRNSLLTIESAEELELRLRQLAAEYPS